MLEMESGGYPRAYVCGPKKWRKVDLDYQFFDRTKKLWSYSDSTANFTVDDQKLPSYTNMGAQKSQLMVSDDYLTTGQPVAQDLAGSEPDPDRPSTYHNFGLPRELMIKFG